MQETQEFLDKLFREKEGDQLSSSIDHNILGDEVRDDKVDIRQCINFWVWAQFWNNFSN